LETTSTVLKNHIGHKVLVTVCATISQATIVGTLKHVHGKAWAVNGGSKNHASFSEDEIHMLHEHTYRKNPWILLHIATKVNDEG